MTKKDISEAKLQSDCFIWFWNNYPEQRQMLFHVNNKARNAIEGNKMKAMGVVKGVSDMILVMPGRVMFIEFKTGTGRQSPEQLHFQQKVEERGHMYAVIRTFGEFQGLVTKELSLAKTEQFL